MSNDRNAKSLWFNSFPWLNWEPTISKALYFLWCNWCVPISISLCSKYMYGTRQFLLSHAYKPKYFDRHIEEVLPLFVMTASGSSLIISSLGVNCSFWNIYCQENERHIIHVYPKYSNYLLLWEHTGVWWMLIHQQVYKWPDLKTLSRQRYIKCKILF